MRVMRIGDDGLMPVGWKETVLYPRTSRVLCVLVVVIGTVTEVSLFALGRPELLLRATPAVAFVVTGVIVLYWLPRLRVGPAELEVVNPLRTHVISWPAVRDIGSKWSLAIDTTAGRITVWAAPSPSPLAEVSRLRRDAHGAATGLAGGRTGSSVGQVAELLIVRQWDAYRDQGVLGAVEGVGVVTTWHAGRIAVLSVLGALMVLGVALP